jgi:D-tyrosyl-tRNA(Tyr) deacylase
MLSIVAMKALLQRVSSARVEIDGRAVGEIENGLLVFLCAVKGDTDRDLEYIVKKVSKLRIFEDDHGKMNLSIMDIKGEVLVVSQFTLAASTRKGNRPSFDAAEAPERARALCDTFVTYLQQAGLSVQTGVFAESMAVSLTNDGPVTILIDSRE